MKKFFVLMTISTVLVTSVIAQKAAKSVYAELGGAGLASANYDMRIMKKEDGLGFRVGIGGFSVSSNYSNGSNTSTDKLGILTVPLELNYLLGKNEKNYFELGAGATIVSIRNKSNNNIGNTQDDKFNSTFGHLYLGYRLQPKDGGFLFRAGITPVFGSGYFIPYWAGISFGYKF